MMVHTWQIEGDGYPNVGYLVLLERRYVTHYARGIMNSMHSDAVIDSCLETIREEIRWRFENEDKKQGLRDIAALWEKLEGVTGLAEARSRILLPHSPVELVPSPDWLTTKLLATQYYPREEEPEHSLPPPHTRTLQNADRIIRFVLPDFPLGLEPRIDRWFKGSIEVEWVLNDRSISWLIYPSNLGFPGCDIRAYTSFFSEEKMESRRLFNIFDLQDHCRNFIAKARGK